MKKTLLIIFLLISALLNLSAYCAPDINFINHFTHCRNYIDNANNKIVIIYGFANRNCHYEEITYDRTTKCSFTVAQLIEISEEMKRKNYNHLDGIETLSSVEKLEYGVCISRSPEL